MCKWNDSRRRARAPTLKHEVTFSATDLTKRFAGVRVLDRVSLDLEAGTVRGLVGANGSGKSTLVKILAGIHTAEPSGVFRTPEGRIPASAMTPSLARRCGLRFVHQNPAVFNELTVAENFALGSGFKTRLGHQISWRQQRAWAAELLDRHALDVSPEARVLDLKPAQRVLLSIIRAIHDLTPGTSGILLLDEPTAALPGREVEELLPAIRRLAADGAAIVFVSHRLNEVLAVADCVQVLRDGRDVGTFPRTELSEDRLSVLMLGRSGRNDRKPPRPRHTPAHDIVLEATGLRGGAVRDVSLSVRSGEIVGIAGAIGSGRSTLLRLLFGVEEIDAGQLRIFSQAVQRYSPRDAMRRGLAFLPEDRSQQAFFDVSVGRNLSAATTAEYWVGGRLRTRRERTDSRALVSDYRIVTRTEESLLSSLSGGNQQKVLLARWLRRDPTILLLDEPSHGVDVGSRGEIQDMLRERAAEGAAVIAVSSDFEELGELSDRVLVMRGGVIVDELSGTELAANRIMSAVYRYDPR